MFEDETRISNVARRELMLFRSSVAAALRELEPFVEKTDRENLVKAAKNARQRFVEERQLNEEQTALLVAISEALLPYMNETQEFSLVDKVRAVVERWQELEKKLALEKQP